MQFAKELRIGKFMKKKTIYDKAIRHFSKKRLKKLLAEPLYCILFTNFHESGDLERQMAFDSIELNQKRQYAETVAEIYEIASKNGDKTVAL